MDTKTTRPDVVVIDQPFEVTLGLRERRDLTLVGSGAVGFAVGETVALDVVLLYDPDSIEVTGSPRASITVSDATPYPSVVLTCTARYGEDLGPQRRLGLQVVRDGQVISVAWRTITAVDTEQQVAIAPVIATRDAALLDLAPLLGEDAPDLVISVCRGDVGSSWIWSAFAADAAVAVPDLPSSTTLEGDIAGFALETRRSIAYSADPSADFLNLAGRARRIGQGDPARHPGRDPCRDNRGRAHRCARRAPADRGARRPVGARLPGARAGDRLGRRLAVPGGPRRDRAVAAHRAPAAAATADRGDRAQRRGAERRLHGRPRLGAPGRRRGRGRRGRRAVRPAGPDRRSGRVDGHRPAPRPARTRPTCCTSPCTGSTTPPATRRASCCWRRARPSVPR